MRTIKMVLDLDKHSPTMVYDIPSIKPQKLIGIPITKDGKTVGEVTKAVLKGHKLYIEANAFSNLEAKETK